ncbi:hypothetical protein CO614_00625 [Lysobacteraceae bacterium NML120232]|nr:hypothetical protein CO614_00625 [Xanthomonadaceae bacterium NML120232]
MGSPRPLNKQTLENLKEDCLFDSSKADPAPLAPQEHYTHSFRPGNNAWFPANYGEDQDND